VADPRHPQEDAVADEKNLTILMPSHIGANVGEELLTILMGFELLRGDQQR